MTEDIDWSEQDAKLLRALAGATFGPNATVTLPSGKELTSDEANWECAMQLRDVFQGGDS